MDIARVGDSTDLPQRVPPSTRKGAPLVETSCTVCGATYLAVKAKPALTCSDECRLVTRQRFKSEGRFVVCATCGKEFRTFPCKRRAKTCSNECRLTWLNSLPRPERKATYRTVTPRGYVRVYVSGRGLVMEHRLVMEEVLGRRLEPQERVHHLDGDRANNAPENLVLCATHSEHLKTWHPDIGGRIERTSRKPAVGS